MTKPIDCKCKDSTKRNEGNQHPLFVQALENPVIIEYLGRKPTQTYTGSVSGKIYKMGGRVQFQCVEKVDVPDFTKIRRAGHKEFRVWKPSPKRPVETTTEDEPKDTGLDDLISLKGIGKATAETLLEGGQTVESLSEIDLENDIYIVTLADTIGVNKSLLIRAIEESIKWAETIQ